jgi:hypothetical protein
LSSGWANPIGNSPVPISTFGLTTCDGLAIRCTAFALHLLATLFHKFILGSNCVIEISKLLRGRQGQKGRVIGMLALVVTFTESGCVIACGPARTVSPQRLSVIAPSPNSYTIRVHSDAGAPIDTPVPLDGRVAFEVPVTSRESTVYCFGLPVHHHPPPDTLRVIRVMRDDRTVNRFSAQDIGRLPLDADGYHILKIDQ